jgi:hypothetical protein
MTDHHKATTTADTLAPHPTRHAQLYHLLESIDEVIAQQDRLLANVQQVLGQSPAAPPRRQR